MAIVVALVFGALVAGVASLALAWPVMLLVGNASIASAGVVPALGYETTVWLVLAALLLFIPSATGSD